jgi:ribosomal protein S10
MRIRSKISKRSEILIKPQQVNVNYSFISLFNPSSVKNLTLYHRNLNNTNEANSIRGSFRNYKILVKQSYLMSAWFYYYANRTLDTKKIKGFATLPCRQTRHTAAKAPMAHKTFSQEQFIIRYYFLTFNTRTLPVNSTNFSSIDKSILISSIFFNANFFSGTNMLVLYKVKS